MKIVPQKTDWEHFGDTLFHYNPHFIQNTPFEGESWPFFEQLGLIKVRFSSLRTPSTFWPF